MLKLAPLKLSVLIPTVPSRKPLLDALLSTLYPQLTDEVELIAILDNKKRTLGQKRREMIKLAQGKYVTFIDDDDEISADYVSEILKGIETDVDLVCYQSEVSINGGPKALCKFSHKFTDAHVHGIYYRKPNHLMVFKKEVALKEDHGNIQWGEDFDWANRIYKHVTSETIIEKVLYHYKSIPKNSECI